MSDEMIDEVEEINDELETLKARADLMGIKYHPAIGVDRLKIKINNALNGSPDSEDKKEISAPVSAEAIKPLTATEFNELERKSRSRKAASLVRVRVTCLNPDKKAWPGEIFSVGSAKLGTFKKYVPFNVDEGWHVPHIIYETMKERQFTQRYTVKVNGQEVTKYKLVNEFAIEVLPPLTKEELKELARKQAMSGSMDKE